MFLNTKKKYYVLIKGKTKIYLFIFILFLLVDLLFYYNIQRLFLYLGLIIMLFYFYTKKTIIIRDNHVVYAKEVIHKSDVERTAFDHESNRLIIKTKQGRNLYIHQEEFGENVIAKVLTVFNKA